MKLWHINHKQKKVKRSCSLFHISAIVFSNETKILHIANIMLLMNYTLKATNTNTLDLKKFSEQTRMK